MDAQQRSNAIKELNGQPLSLMVQSLLSPDLQSVDVERELVLAALLVDVAQADVPAAEAVVVHEEVERLGLEMMEPEDPWATAAQLLMRQEPGDPRPSPEAIRRQMMRLYLIAKDEGAGAKKTVASHLLDHAAIQNPQIQMPM